MKSIRQALTDEITRLSKIAESTDDRTKAFSQITGKIKGLWTALEIVRRAHALDIIVDEREEPDGRREAEGRDA